MPRTVPDVPDALLPAQEQVRSYFADADGLAGNRSLHGAMVAAASGVRGAPSAPDAAWTAGRVSRVAQWRMSAEAAAAAGDAVMLVLWCVYGRPEWPGPAPDTADGDVGKREGQRRRWTRGAPPPQVRAQLGHLAFVVLTDPAVAAESRRTGRPPEACVLALCTAGGAMLQALLAAAGRRLVRALRVFDAERQRVEFGGPRPRARRYNGGWTAVEPPPKGVRG